MSGGQVAYHLRPNKAIERHIFMDVLTRFHGYRPIHSYTYVGFGGPFLEDFRLVEGLFGVARMISLEGDRKVLDRQAFNRPFTAVDCRCEMSGDFITKFSPREGENTIVWLDYAAANDRLLQLNEFQTLLEKLQPYDIAKVTLNSNAGTLASRDLPAAQKREAQYQAAEAQLSEFWAGPVTAADITKKRFPTVVLGAVLNAARRALPPTRGVQFVPITSFTYADSDHDMLTVTGAIIPRNEVSGFRAALRLRRWDLAYREKDAPISIMTPMLSLRERVYLERLLPRFRRTLASRGGFLVAASRGESDRLLQSFARFYRYYPHFGRILP